MDYAATRADARTGRLPRTVVPERYEVALKVDPESGVFSGQVKVRATVASPTKEVTLHAVGLKIRSASVGGQQVDPASIVYDEKQETITLVLPRELAAGETTLELAYEGSLNGQMKGLYLSKADHEGKKESYAFTHFEPTDARRMVPSFDEPDFKAVFKLTATVPAHLSALSNMPAERETRDGAWKTVVFGDSPKMSTYLLALAVARLTPKTRVVDGTQVTVWTRPAEASQADFALDAAEYSLKWLNRYFDLPYQLPKMDLVAVPDFSAGAMENWGAIFFRDSALLVDPKLSSTRAKRRVAEVVAHEIVHQWFGNLVTMKWWNDLWLNEAFATWLAYAVVDDWQPAWNTWLAFDARRQSPLAIDALDSTRPIQSDAVSSAEIRSMFDPLTYAKGGTILRMIESFIGEEAFRAGIRAYMRKHRFGNTEATDLWKELEAASGQPVERIAQDWLGQPGYPMVKVSSLSPDHRTLKLTQVRFNAAGREDASLGTWAVPVVLHYEENGRAKSHRVLLEGPETTVTLPGKGAVSWIYPNQGETGFYRIALDESLLASLMKSSGGALEEVERTGLLSHLWAQAQAGARPVTAALDALLRFKGATSRSFLETAAGYLVELRDGLVKAADLPRFQAVVEELLRPHWERLGWGSAQDDDETRLARAAVLQGLGYAGGDERLLAEARAKLEAYLSDPSSVETTLVSPLLSLGARHGDAALFERYRERMLGASTPEVRDQYLKALSQFRDPALARRMLEMTLSDDIRSQDFWKPVMFLLKNPDARAEAWRFLKARWPEVRKKAGPRGTEWVIQGLAAVSDEALAAEIKAFFADPANQEPAARRTLAQTLEFIGINLRFKAAQTEPVARWLAARP